VAVLTSLADHCLARERAANYFTLLDVFKKPEIAGELWEVLGRSWDLNRPFAAGIANALGRFDVDDAVLLAAREQVSRPDWQRFGPAMWCWSGASPDTLDFWKRVGMLRASFSCAKRRTSWSCRRSPSWGRVK
jgi:hypothetical protein